MKKDEIKERIRSAIEGRDLCRVYLKYDLSYYYYLPLKMSEGVLTGGISQAFV